MLSGRVKLQLAAFTLLSAGVAGNLLLLQTHVRGLRGAERQMAGAGLFEFGDTGSISRTDATAAAGSAPSLDLLAAVEIPQDAAELTRAVQRELQVRGYETGGVDGKVGLMTRAAIMGFEHDQGLALTGDPSQELLKRILLGAGEAAAKPVGSAGQSVEAGDVIRSVQTSLTKLGYKPGHIDGQLSPETVRAIREFEVDQALPESGRVSGPLVARLASEGRIASGR